MIKILQIIILVIISLLMMSASCDKGSEGCTDSTACNYDETAAIDDNSCWFASTDCSCDDPPGAQIDCLEICDADILNDPPDLEGDGNCDEGVIGGCIDSLICNFNINATHNNDSCAVDLSQYGGSVDGTDCNEYCDGFAVEDNCELCVGGETTLGQSWRLKIISEVTFKLSNNLQIGSDKDSVTLGSSIFAKDGYNGTELNEDGSSCNDCYIDVPKPPVTGEENNNFIQFYFPHNEDDEWEEWESQFESSIDQSLFDSDIRGNDYYSLFSDDIGLNWYAEIRPFLSETTILDDLGNSIIYSPMIDSVKLDFIYLEGIASEESEKFTVKVFLDREKGETEGGIECEFEENKVNLAVDSDKIIKLLFNISNLCFSEYEE